jgi:hypothetical protein
MPEGLATFDYWSKAGYKIKKGEKATKYDGVPMFYGSQVEKYVKKQYYSNINLGDHKGNGSWSLYPEEEEDEY